MTTELGKLKEQKFPRCHKETAWDEHALKLEMSCRTRGNATKVMNGEHRTEVTAPGENGACGVDETAKANENNRVHADSIKTMPNRTLTRIAKNSKSLQFPTGCAKTVLENLEKELWGSMLVKKRKLTRIFETTAKLDCLKNPVKCLDKLIDAQEQLEEDCDVDRTIDDILEQLIKMLGEDFDNTKNEVRKALRAKQVTNMDEVKEELREVCQEILGEKLTKIKVANDSSEEDETEEKAMPARQHYINPEIPNVAFVASNQDTNNRTPWQFQRAFKGMCNRCGAQGHKGADCPNLKTEAQNTSNLQTTNQQNNVNNDPFQPKCESCGRAHQTYNCYSLEVNKAN